MTKHVVLFKFTEKGVADVKDSPNRAEAFGALAQKLGAKVEKFLWLSGQYDGMAIIDAPDEETMAALSLSTAKLGNVSSCTLRAYDAGEFRKVLAKVQ